MRSRSTIFVAYVLAGLFTVFNVGLPIIYSVCPMMKDGSTACDCRNVGDNRSAIDYQRSNCCNVRILAERNTIPFVGTDKYQAPNSEFAAFLPLGAFASLDGLKSSSIHDGFNNTGPPSLTTPIYILSSSLLI